MKLLSITAIAVAATASAQAAIFEPAAVKVTNGFTIEPQLESSVSYDDNIYTDNTDEVSSAITLVKPLVVFGTDDGVNQYGGEYELVAGFYSEDSDNNYVDHNLTLTAHTEFTDKHRTDFTAGFSNLHENWGSNITETDSTAEDEPYKYNTYLGDAYYQYGAESALLNIGVGIQYEMKDYQNFSSVTDEFDYSTWTGMLDSDYQVGDITSLTIDLSVANTVYPDNENKDNTDSNMLIGLSWEGAGNMIGEVKLGYQHKDFDLNTYEDFNGASADVGIEWKPVQRSDFEWHVIREAEDSYDVGDYVLVLATSLEWTHDWTNKFSSYLSYTYNNEEYVGSTADREDDIVSASLNLTYEFTRWVKMTAGYEYTENDSTSESASYDQSVVNLGVTVAL